MMSIQVTKNRNNDSDQCLISIIEKLDIQFQDKDFMIDEKNEYKPHFPILSYISDKKNKFEIPIVFLLGIVKISLQKTCYTLELEEPCSYGLYCPFKTNPLKCPFNHHEMPKRILKGSYIPTLVCRYELYKENGIRLFCNNPYCWYNHGKGRAQRIFHGFYHRY
jgi:hypothetical protein